MSNVMFNTNELSAILVDVAHQIKKPCPHISPLLVEAADRLMRYRSIAASAVYLLRALPKCGCETHGCLGCAQDKSVAEILEQWGNVR